MTPEQLDAHLRRFNQIFAKEFSYAADPDYGSLEIIRGGKVLTTWCYADDPSDGFAEYKESAFQGYLLCAENMEVEIPTISIGFFVTDVYKAGFDHCVKEVTKKLESQGIKVKK